MKRGKYRESMIDEVKALARFGLTDDEIANFYHIDHLTLENYKRNIPEFYEALEEGRMIDSMKVVDSLHKQALGYMVVETEESETLDRQGNIVKLKKIIHKHIHPNVTAAIYLLKTRHGDKWMDIVRTENTQNLNIAVKNVDFSDITTEELITLKKLGIRRLPQEFTGQKMLKEPKNLPMQDVQGN